MVQVGGIVLAADALRRSLDAHVTQDVAAQVGAAHRRPGVYAGVIEEDAPPTPALGVGHKANRLRRRAVGDQRPAYAQGVVAVEVDLGARLDGQRVARRNPYVAVDDVGLVARPEGVRRDGAAERLIAAAGGDGEGEGGRVRPAIGRYVQREGDGVVVPRAGGDGESVGGGRIAALPGGDVTVGGGRLLQRNVGVGGAEHAGHAGGIQPVVAQGNHQRGRLAGGGAAQRVAVHRRSGQRQHRVGVLHRGGGVDAPRAQLTGVGRVEGVEVVRRLHQLVAHHRRCPLRPAAADQSRQAGDEGGRQAGAVGGAVVAAEEGGGDRHGGGGQVHPVAVVGEGRFGVVIRRSGHGQHVVIGGGVERGGGVVVPRAAHDHRALVGGVGHRLPQGVGVGIPA